MATLDGLNPEPTDIQLAIFHRHKEAGTVPNFPDWYKKTMRAWKVKPFAPQFSVIFPARAMPTPIAIPQPKIPACGAWESTAEYVKAYCLANGIKY